MRTHRRKGEPETDDVLSYVQSTQNTLKFSLAPSAFASHNLKIRLKVAKIIVPPARHKKNEPFAPYDKIPVGATGDWRRLTFHTKIILSQRHEWDSRKNQGTCMFKVVFSNEKFS